VLRTKLHLRLAPPEDPAVAAAAARRTVDSHAAAAAKENGGPEAVRESLEGRLREVRQRRAALEAEDSELRKRLGIAQPGAGWVWWAVGAAGVAGVAGVLLARK
jgi:hypothetical protein